MLVMVLVSCSNSGNSDYKTDSTTVPAQPVDDGHKPSRGEAIFKQRCIVCHGLNGRYHNDNAADLKMSRLDSLGITTVIKNGKTPMPMFGRVIPDSDMVQLVYYVQSLRQ